MHRTQRLISLLLIATALLAGCARLRLADDAQPAAPAKPAPIKLLVVTGGHPYDVEPFRAMFGGMEGIETTFHELAEHSEIFEDISDWDYDALLLYNMTAEISPMRVRNFQALLEMGVGLVPLHHGTLSWPARPEFREIFGVDFPQAGAFGFHIGERFQYRIADPNHPITQGQQPFDAIDETYTNFYGDGAPGNQVLYRTDHKPSDAELVWVRRQANALVCSIQGGHDAAMFTNPAYVGLIERAVRWTTGRLPEALGGEALIHTTRFRQHERAAALAALPVYALGDSRWAQNRVAERVTRALAQPGSDAALAGELAALLGDARTTREAHTYLCRQLARLRDPRTIGPLAAGLRDPQRAHMARYALAAMEHPRADRALRVALGDTTPALQVGLIETLGIRRDVLSTADASRLMDSDDATLAAAATLALGRIATPRAVRTLLRAYAHPKTSQTALPTALQLAAEASEHDGARSQALRVYRTLWEAGRTAEDRAAGLLGLARLQGDAALDAVAAGLAAPPPLRDAAIMATRRLDDANAIPMLGAAYLQAEPAVQLQLIAALAVRGTPASEAWLLRAMDNGDAAVRLAAIEGLQRCGAASALQPLLQARIRARGEERAALDATLASMGGADVDAKLLELARGAADDDTRLPLIQVLVARHVQAALPLLIEQARGGNAALAQSAWNGLGSMAPASELPRLLELLSAIPPADTARQRAATAGLRAMLTRIVAPEQALAAIQAAMPTAPPPAQRILVQLAAVDETTDSAAFITSIAREASGELRLEAVRVLGGWSTAQPAPLLLEVARTTDDPRTRAVALTGYLDLLRLPHTRSDSESLACYTALLPLTTTDQMRGQVLDAIATIPRADALELLLDASAPRAQDATTTIAAAAAVRLAGELAPLDPKSTIAAMDRLLAMQPGAEIAAAARAAQQRSAELGKGLIAFWGFDKDAGDWSAAHDLTLQTLDGLLHVACTGGDPYMLHPVQAPGPMVLLQFRARYRGDGPMFVFWITDQNQRWGEVALTAIHPLHPLENQWQTYQVPLSVTGTMTLLRIDPLLGTGTVDFDWIRLITPDSPLVAK